MKMKIIINGCNGRMGRVLAQLASQKNEVVCGISRTVPQDLPFPIFTDLSQAKKIHADVLIDFSTASAIPNLIDFCQTQKLPTVICTTGIDADTEEKIIRTAEIIPIFKSANMSIGVNVLNMLIGKLSKKLYEMDYDIEILEKHHNKKIDAPSGTALLLANTIIKSTNDKLHISYDRNHLRDKNELGISCVRGGTIIGEHNVIFAGQNETIELKHCAQSREIFASGALKAAEFIMNKTNGLYSMNDLIAFSPQ